MFIKLCDHTGGAPNPVSRFPRTLKDSSICSVLTAARVDVMTSSLLEASGKLSHSQRVKLDRNSMRETGSQIKARKTIFIVNKTEMLHYNPPTQFLLLTTSSSAVIYNGVMDNACKCCLFLYYLKSFQILFLLPKLSGMCYDVDIPVVLLDTGITDSSKHTIAVD